MKPLFAETKIHDKGLIQVFLGHKDIRTTEIYTKIFNHDVFKCFPDVHEIIRRYIRCSKKNLEKIY